MLHFHYLFPYIYGKDPFQSHVKSDFRKSACKNNINLIFIGLRRVTGSQSGACHLVKIKAMLEMLDGGENICGWLFMMEPLGYHCIRK